jgi:ABC-type transport system involved in Fe-S cluster assembly fused permease/ATPase subunit
VDVAYLCRSAAKYTVRSPVATAVVVVLKLTCVLGSLYPECRLVEPTSGELLIDGVNVLNISLHELRNNIAIVPQVMC